MTTLEARLNTILPTLATKGDVEALKTEIHKSTSETHRWMIGTAIGLFFGFGALFLAMSNSYRPMANHGQQPVVISIPQALPVSPSLNGAAAAKPQ